MIQIQKLPFEDDFGYDLFQSLMRTRYPGLIEVIDNHQIVTAMDPLDFIYNQNRVEVYLDTNISRATQIVRDSNSESSFEISFNASYMDMTPYFFIGSYDGIDAHRDSWGIYGSSKDAGLNKINSIITNSEDLEVSILSGPSCTAHGMGSSQMPCIRWNLQLSRAVQAGDQITINASLVRRNCKPYCNVQDIDFIYNFT